MKKEKDMNYDEMAALMRSEELDMSDEEFERVMNTPRDVMGFSDVPSDGQGRIDTVIGARMYFEKHFAKLTKKAKDEARN